MSKTRAIAVYLPQFHPIPENDEWWGKGFTEWRNVAKTKPRFAGHYQPHLPGDFGFYDLRVHALQVEQAKLAREHGLTGFCYYHYWFNGKRLLERPLDQLLANKDPDFPFMLCWANENWTRRWDGMENEVLMKQDYSDEDDVQHMTYLSEVFKDPRYIRIDGRPVFVVYRPALFPDIARTANTWREVCRKNGTGEIYLMFMQAFHDYTDPAVYGFDAAVDFQPDFWAFPPPSRVGHNNGLVNRLFGKGKQKHNEDKVFLYEDIVRKMLARKTPSFKRYPSVFPMWDNSARRENGAAIIHGSTPEKYGAWLSKTVADFKPYSGEENFVFLNAWNEWAEGNHLEPDAKWGRAYLEMTKKALDA